jgi:RNA 2',3'-cyclic 3'-phosphodiesterase
VRLFAAVDPPPPIVTELARQLGEPDSRLRYVPAKQWHLTTAFFGDVAETALPDLTDRLNRAAARSVPMTLALRGVGTFPRNAARARVLWVGIDGDLDGLSRLADRCRAAGRRAGLTMEDRSYRPHLTLARARRDQVDLNVFVESMASYRSDPWQVTDLRLVHSTLGAEVRHETIASFPLTGKEPPLRDEFGGAQSSK